MFRPQNMEYFSEFLLFVSLAVNIGCQKKCTIKNKGVDS